MNVNTALSPAFNEETLGVILIVGMIVSTVSVIVLEETSFSLPAVSFALTVRP